MGSNKSWRPDNWDNPHLYFGSPHTLYDYESNDKRVVFEAGADAMYKAIWKLAKESPTGTFIFDTNVINVFEEVKQ